MLNVSDEVKNLFLKDSTKKKLIIEVEDSDRSNPNELNFYSGSFPYQEYATTIAEGLSPITVEDFTNAVDMRLIHYVKYVRLSLGFRVHDITTAPDTLTFRVYVEREHGTEYKDLDVTLSEYTNNYHRFFCAAFDSKTQDGYIGQITDVQIINSNATAFQGTITMFDYQVDMVNYELDFPTTYNTNFSKNIEDLSNYMPLPNIENDNIDFESFSLTESLCSQDNIKFGLCESAHCEFTTIGYNDNLKDRIIKPKISAQGLPSKADVLSVNFWKDQSGVMRKGDTYSKTFTITDSTYYNDNWLVDTWLFPYDKYFSEYGYVYFACEIKFANMNVISGPTPHHFKLGLWLVYEDGTEDRRFWDTTYRYSESWQKIQVAPPYIIPQVGKKIKTILRLFYKAYDENGNLLENPNTTVDYSMRNFQVQVADKFSYSYPYDINKLYVYDNTLDAFFSECYCDPIPLGTFHVTDVKLEHKQNLVKQQVTAYDHLVKLEQNAANWYTQYMFTVTTDDYQGRYDVEYKRQIYSTFFDFAVAMGFDDRKYHTETLVNSWAYSDIRSSMMSTKRLYYQVFGQPDYLEYSEITVNDVNPAKFYMVDAVNYNGQTDEELLALTHGAVNDYAEKVDSLRRGLATNAGVIVEAYNSSGMISSYLLNRRDYFFLPEGTTYIKILVTVDMIYNSQTAIYPLIDSVSLYECGNAPELVNGDKNLFYYNYSTGEISDVGTSITGRDVVRSLLEVCGCFFRLDRQNGLPEFIYCTKGGLYPRNDLYPADDLFPRAGTDQTLPNGRYMSATQDNYQVQDYGKIQIIVDSDTNTSKSVCEMEYEGDNQSINTYLIDDNIFYSNKNMDVEYQYAYGLLQNMFARISNMGYVPNVTEAIGMPWIECGDRIGILTYTSGFESFIFRRTLKGIQLLKDTYESAGDEYTEAVKDFGYEEFN